MDYFFLLIIANFLNKVFHYIQELSTSFLDLTNIFLILFFKSIFLNQLFLGHG